MIVNIPRQCQWAPRLPVERRVSVVSWAHQCRLLFSDPRRGRQTPLGNFWWEPQHVRRKTICQEECQSADRAIGGQIRRYPYEYCSNKQICYLFPTLKLTLKLCTKLPFSPCPFTWCSSFHSHYISMYSKWCLLCRQFGNTQLWDRGSFRSVRLVHWQYSVGFCASVGTASLPRWTYPGRRSTSCPGSSGRLRHGRLRRQSSRSSAYDCTGDV